MSVDADRVFSSRRLESIRAKILMGCLALATLTAALGAYSQIAQRELAGLATTIYDDAFMGVSYLRSAQVHFGDLSRRTESAGLNQLAVAAILDDLEVASERAMSAAGKQEVDALRSRISAASAADHSLDTRRVRRRRRDVRRRWIPLSPFGRQSCRRTGSDGPGSPSSAYCWRPWSSRSLSPA